MTRVAASDPDLGDRGASLCLSTSNPGAMRSHPAGSVVGPDGWPGQASLRTALATTVFVACATVALSALLGHQSLVQAAQWLVLGLVLVPLLMAIALVGATAVCSAMLVLLALPWLLLRRPTGLRTTLVALWRLPVGVLPGYLRAVRRVRRPTLWGAVLGVCLGAAVAVAA